MNWNSIKKNYESYTRIILSFLIAAVCVRVYEHHAIADKSLLAYPLLYEIGGLVFDVWAVLIYGIFLAPIFLGLSALNKKIGFVFLHFFNLLFLSVYIGLIMTFSERNNPFDHELFNREAFEIWDTIKQMITRGVSVFLPFVFSYFIYWIAYISFLKKIKFKEYTLSLFFIVSIIATLSMRFAQPSTNLFKDRSGYYLSSNKFSYWIADSYHFLFSKEVFDSKNLNTAELAAAIDFYQHNQPFNFNSKEYPLLHQNDENDVLGQYFNFDPIKPPNIVIIVTEGLSKDFSGANAYASSFTPFLDSLSNFSLTWDNFLSTSPGTFAAHPAIEGSLPYGKRGFSSLPIMPDHLSLINILKANGYHTKFLTGSNTDFDNMGGFIRRQGTDMSYLQFGSKYKKMSASNEGWGMGYPDDALFNRSLEIMDSIPTTPYLNIYHTATTHVPYLFDQKLIYEKLFDKKIKTLTVTPEIKKILKETKRVLVTFMFADDCFSHYFKQYAKRPEFNNTIFFITGDHHIGSFPSTSSIDDYHVPLIIYSPMLKAPKKFYSINSHNNLAPTIVSMILNNYKNLPYHPKQVNWMAGVMDTFAGFRNNQSMPFMYSSRVIEDYIWKEYIISEKELYKLGPDLSMTPFKNDSIKNHITNLLNNYKIINSYVCDNNKIFHSKELEKTEGRDILFEYDSQDLKKISITQSATNLIADLNFSLKYSYLFVEVSAETNMIKAAINQQPSIRFALFNLDNGKKNYPFYINHEINQLVKKGAYISDSWNTIQADDIIPLNDFKKIKQLQFSLALFCLKPIKLDIKNIHIKVWGVM